MRDAAYVSGHVTSHTNTLPLFHGTMAIPSGWFRVISIRLIYAWWFQTGGDFGWVQGPMDDVISGRNLNTARYRRSGPSEARLSSVCAHGDLHGFARLANEEPHPLSGMRINPLVKLIPPPESGHGGSDLLRYPTNAVLPRHVAGGFSTCTDTCTVLDATHRLWMPFCRLYVRTGTPHEQWNVLAVWRLRALIRPLRHWGRHSHL